MSQFKKDDNGQKAVRDAVLAPGLYGPISFDGRYVFADKGHFAGILQKRFAIDTLLQKRGSRELVAIDEKIVRWKGKAYTKITLETQSCTKPGHESDGWMVYTKAQWLNYVCCQENGDVLCHIIDQQALKKAFWPVFETFDETISRQFNRTACRKVPLEWIRENVGCVSKLIRATPEGAAIVRAYNAIR